MIINIYDYLISNHKNALLPLNLEFDNHLSMHSKLVITKT